MSDGSHVQYRSISWAAIVALALAVVSVVAVFNALLVALAIGAAGLSLIALWQISANPDVLSGRGLALTALAISVFFMVFAPTRVTMRSQVLQRRGEQLSEAFLSMLREGKTREAHQISHLKQSSPMPIDGGNPSDLSNQDLKIFEESKIVRALKQLDFKFDYQLEGVEPSATYAETELFVYRYRIIPAESTGKRPFKIWITVARDIDPRSGMTSWRISDIKDVFKPAA